MKLKGEAGSVLAEKNHWSNYFEVLGTVLPVFNNYLKKIKYFFSHVLPKIDFNANV